MFPNSEAEYASTIPIQRICRSLGVLAFGQTAVVTGGTVGIGFEVSKAIALAGARVLLLSRHSENAEEAISKIKAEASPNGPIPDITFISCDLGNLERVKVVGDQIREQEERLDLVRPSPGHPQRIHGD